MDLISLFGDNLLSGITIILAFLFALTVVVFVHEMGHFLVARWCGVDVEAFSIGFGKELLAFTDNKGTRWRIAAIPLGGYVKFMDDEGVASTPSTEKVAHMSEDQRRGTFQLKPLWQRAAVVAAGPIANFLLAIAIFALLFMLVGITRMEPRVSKVVENTPAAAAGFEAGDLILEIDGRRIDDFGELRHMVSLAAGSELTFLVDRGGTPVTLVVQPEIREQEDQIAGKHSRPIIGIQASAEVSKITHERLGPLSAIAEGTEKTYDIITGTLTYIGDIFMQRQSAEQIGGIVRIADAAGKVAAIGFAELVFFTAFISVSIGLINLFPIPLLDGGHLVFYAIEAVRGKPLDENAQEISFRIGLAVILGLMLFGFYNDLGILARWFSWAS